MRPARLPLAAALVLLGAVPVGAQGADEPPAALERGASLSGQSLSLSGTSLSLSAAPLSLPTTPVSTPSGAVGAGSAPVTAGMKVEEERGGGLRFTLDADLLFDFDKADLRPAADEVLRGLVAQVEARLPRGRFRVEGHTDGKGSDRDNDGLSSRRARSVESWLTRRGRVAAGRITTAGYGRRRPVAANQKPDGSDDPDGRQLNRRVEIVVLPPA